MVNASSPSVFYVNPVSGQDSGDGSSARPYRTIARALQRAKASDTIQLGTGTYSAASGEQFPLVVPSKVAIVGDEVNWGKGIVIEGSGTYSSGSFVPQNVTLVLSDQAELRGVTVINRATNGTGVWVESAGPSIAHSTLTQCSREGIFVCANARPEIVDNRFEQNATSGISMVRHAKGEVYRNVFRNNGYGIAIGENAAPLLTANTLTQNRAGIVVWGNARPVLRRNRVESNSSDGLVLMNEAQADLGQAQDPGYNVFRNNGNFDLRNATTAAVVVSTGNDLKPTRIQGRVDFLATELLAAEPMAPSPQPSQPQPTPTPTPSPTVSSGTAQFNDMAGHWAELFVSGLAKLGLIRGFVDGTFRPDDKVTRAQYAAILAAAFPRAAVRPATNFSDISPTFWGYSAIRQANAAGFLSGFPDGTFRPDLNLTRVQAMTALVNGLQLTGGTPNSLVIYRDRAQIPSYATAAIATATQRRMVVNYPQWDQLNPMRDITRGEMAAVVYQALVADGRATAVTSPYIVRPDTSTPLFSDIEGHWASKFIYALSNQGFINGFADGTFRPEEPMTRAQFAVLLSNAFDPSVKRPATQFTDVPSDFWGAKAIQKVYQGGFLSGFPNQTFAPNQSVSRVQVLISLVNGLEFGTGNERVLQVYEDEVAIPGFARPLVAAATERGLVVNAPQSKQLRPNQAATRADVAAMVYQARVALQKSPAIDSPYIVKVDPPISPTEPPATEPPVTNPPLTEPPLTEPTPEIETPTPTPIAVTVVVDPGHGGTDPGAIGRDGLQEKGVVLAVAQEVAQRLQQASIRAVMTRSDDRALELAARVEFAERERADLFASIHANAISLTRPEINGLETYHYPGSRRSAALAEAIHRQILQTVPVKDRGVRQANFHVLRETSMPAVLVEIGFVTGEEDAPRLADPAHQSLLAQAITAGVLDYIKSRP